MILVKCETLNSHNFNKSKINFVKPRLLIVNGDNGKDDVELLVEFIELKTGGTVI